VAGSCGCHFGFRDAGSLTISSADVITGCTLCEGVEDAAAGVSSWFSAMMHPVVKSRLATGASDELVDSQPVRASRLRRV